ncbi:protein three rows [Drosophila eugracilis]|uniref:protein three rows n=1 Tax=Drosophila eugracilis TaxID=29029 RepID=UPI0007E81E0D|nr:protein three rows [Drosophila eugracilis]
MSSDIANQLKGSRSDVEKVCKTVEAKFRLLTEESLPLRYEVNVLRHICIALKDNIYQNADLYCDIVGTMLPRVVPYMEKPSLWEAHLTSLRYIHHCLCQERSIEACQKLYNLIRAQPCLLQQDTDHKAYLDIHLTHFNGIHLQLQRQKLPLEATRHLGYALECLGELFDIMRQREMTQSGPLLAQLNESLFGKRSRTFFKTLSFLPSESLSKMFIPLLKLLASSSVAELPTLFSEYLSFTLALVQIDILSPQSNQQLSLQLLRMCKELFRQESNLNYSLQLFYYYIKLIYVRGPSSDFKRAYIDLSQKFQNFFEHKTVSYVKEQWVTDLLVAFQLLQVLIQQNSSKSQNPFQFFWQNFEGDGSPEIYTAHFQLLHICGGLAVNVTRSPLGCSCTNEACKSVRRHCIMAYGLCALDAYINWQPTQEQKTDRSPHKPLLGIVKYTMDVAKTMKCLGPTSVELIKLVRQLIYVADQVSCPEQMSVLLPLLEQLQKLRPLIADQEMSGFLRRLFKASSHCKDLSIASRLQASFLASLTNPVRLRSQICLYYHNQGKEGKEITKCVYEWHESSPLPSPLTPAQKKQLYDTDFFAVLHYLRNPSPAHMQSLIRCRKNDYHLVLLAREMRNDASILNECKEMRSKLKQKGSLSRMEHLCLGHANVGLLLEALEAQKTKVSTKEINENLFEELLLRQNLSQINIKREQRLVQLASESISVFNYFFSQADQEPLGIEETYIDWEALIDDAVSSALGLSSMGYQSEADDAWLLLLRIGRWLEDRFTYLRALNHFLSQNQVNSSLKLKLSDEVEWAEEWLDDLWPQLQNGRFYKRQHTVVMLSFCHLASYYARMDCLSHAQLLLLQVEQLREEFPERLGKSDIVLITLQAVRFRLSYQQGKPKTSKMLTPLRRLDTLLENVRNFCNLSSLDSGSLQLLLSTLVRESTECSSNRLSERLAFSNIVLHLVLQSGLALRSIEVFLAWLWTNLQMENFAKAQSKLRLIEHCLDIKQLTPKESHPEKEAIKDPTIIDLTSNMHLLQLVEPIRKQQQLNTPSLKLLNMQQNTPNPQLNLDRYFTLDMAPSIVRENTQLQCVYFIMGCLHARLHFLQRNSDQLDEFYERANNWIEEKSQMSAALGSMLQVQQLYHLNYLRFRRKHDEAISTAQLGLKMRLQAVDINFGYNFMAQLKTAKIELKPLIQEKSKSKTLRRALIFNLSPEDKHRTQSASAIKDRASKAKQSAKKAPRFRIYEELALRPPSAASNSSGGSGSENTPPSNNVDLNACQPIEISDDEDLLSLPQKKSQAKSRDKTKSKTAATASEVITLDNSLEMVSTPSVALSSRSTRAKTRQPLETPKTAPLSTRRPRRQVTEPPVPDTESISTRTRHRH